MKVLVAVCALFASTFGAPSLINQKVGNPYPYLVSIQNTLFGNQHQCGGTILSPYWIATAAHCVGISLLTSRIVAGASNLSDVENNNAQIRTIDMYNVIKHPDYNEISNDIALLKMTEPFEFNDYVQPVPISKLPCVASDESISFSGWGSGDFDTSILKIANLTIVPYDECFDSIYAVYGNNVALKDELHVCVKGVDSPCIQDGGSPLIQDNRLIGLLSWLPTICLDGGIPAIFTKTGYFKSFIKQYVDDLPY